MAAAPNCKENSRSADSNPYLDTSLITRFQQEYSRDKPDHENDAYEMKGLDESSISTREHSLHTTNTNQNKPTQLQPSAISISLTKSSNDYIDIENEPITLDIGGTIFRTTLHTLKKYPHTLFARMFSGKYSMKPNKNGTYFIDRDGTNFRYILNYLRTSKLIIPSNNQQLIAELLEECTFYNIPHLINSLSIKQIDTKILKEKHISRLNNLIINKILPNNKDKQLTYSWNLLYRFESDMHMLHNGDNKYTKFSRNTLESSYIVLKDFVFLSKIAGHSPTLIIVSADKYILGGFTTIEWPSHCSQWKKKTILSNDSTHSTWDFLEFWSPNPDECKDQFQYTFIYKFVNDGEDEKERDDSDRKDEDRDEDIEQQRSFFEYKTTASETNEFGHPELHGTIKTHREDWNQSPLPYFRTCRPASDCFDKSKPHIDDRDHLYLYNVDGSVVINNPWTKQQSYVRAWECFQLEGYKY
eukprot:496129_1